MTRETLQRIEDLAQADMILKALADRVTSSAGRKRLEHVRDYIAEEIWQWRGVQP